MKKLTKEEMNIHINSIIKKEVELQFALEHAKNELKELKEKYDEIKSHGLNSPSTEFLIEYYAELLSDK